MSSGPLVYAGPTTNIGNSLFSDKLSTKARSVDDQKYYVAELYQPDTSLSFRAFVPESFSMQLQNHWEPIFGGAEGAASTTLGKTAQALGVAVNAKYLTRRVWVGTEPIDFSFTFLLDAYSSTFQDVEQPIRNLAKMASPFRKGAFLFSPGPNAVSDKNRIYLRIGKFMIIDSVIINNIDITFFSVADRSDGRYMSADINIHVSTNYTPDEADIERFFNNGQSNNNSLDPSNATIVPQSAGAALDKIIDGAKNYDYSQIIPNIQNGIGNLITNQNVTNSSVTGLN